MAIQHDTTHLEYLDNRGISADTARTYNITYLAPSEKYPRPAIIYPTVEYSDDSQMKRVKYIDGQKPKNIWLGQKPEGKFTLYDPTGGLRQVISDIKGVCWWLNGEPAVWAFHTFRTLRGADAKRIAPASCLMGEGRGLSDFESRRRLVSLLNQSDNYGIRELHVIVDTDKKGLSSAYRLYRTICDPLRPVNMRLVFYQLPFAFTENNGKDFNDLWLSLGCDHERTVKQLSQSRIDDIDHAWGWLRDCLGRDTVQQIDADFDVDAGIQTRREYSTPNLSSDATWVDYLRALTSAWEREFNYAGGYKNDGWSKKNVRNHWRGEQDASAGYNRISGYMQDFGDDSHCYDAKALGERLGLTWPFNGHKPQSVDKGQLHIAPAAAPEWAVPTNVLVTVDEAAESIRRHMRGDVSDTGESIPFPLKSLHAVGIEIAPAGKIVIFGGGTGQGKTALNETCIDNLNLDGIWTIGNSPEWTPIEIMQRRIQRYSRANDEGKPSVTYLNLLSDIMHSKEAELGIAPEYRHGRPLSAAQRSEVERVLRSVTGWHGKHLSAWDGKPNTPPLYLERFLECVADTLSDNRKRKIRTAVFIDYLQLADVQERDNDFHILEQVMRKLKAHVNTHLYPCFATTQITKSAQKNGELVTGADAQWLRADQSNIFLTINREYEEIQDGAVKLRKYLNAAKLYSDKNSFGAGQDYVRMPLDLARLRWIDEILPNSTQEI